MEFLVERVEIFLGEGGDIELGAWTSKHIFVFVFGYLSLNSTLFISYIAAIVYLYMLDIVCVLILVLIQESYWSLNFYKIGILTRSSKALH